MIPGTILYVDDEAMALKYFDKLVAPLAPVLTAPSVAQGKAVLDQRAGEIAVLVADQRMPGAHGNELLRYARERHPNVVRMLTTAYSELGEAIEAINAGEIYRYITKPWEVESLHADLRNALELAVLRAERDSLLREKMQLQQQQLLGHRAGQLVLLCAGAGQDTADALHAFLSVAIRVGCPLPVIDWRVSDHADLIQMEVARGAAMRDQLERWRSGFESVAQPGQALAALARALPGHARLQGDALQVNDSRIFTDLLAGPPQELPAAAQVAWLAWLLRWSGAARVQGSATAWEVVLEAGASTAARLPDWLAGDIEQLQLTSARV